MVARLNSLFNKDCRHCHDHVKSLITNQEQKPTGRMSWYHPSWRQETWRRAIMKTTRMEQKTLGRIAIIKVVWHDQVTAATAKTSGANLDRRSTEPCWRHGSWIIRSVSVEFAISFASRIYKTPTWWSEMEFGLRFSVDRLKRDEGNRGVVERALILEYDVEGVNDTGNPTQDGQTDVDQKISTTSSLKENTQRRQDDRKQDLANVRSSERHLDLVLCRVTREDTGGVIWWISKRDDEEVISERRQ